MKYFRFAAGIFAFAATFAAVQSSSDYSYSSQNHWPGECTSGKKQSPINIQTLHCNTYLKPLLLSHEYYTTMSGTWENKGHTVQFTPHTKAYMLTPIGTYKLLQVHMHWGSGKGSGSEHYINGRPADLEVHFVHKKVGSVDQTDCDYYAVLGVRGNASPYVPLSDTLRQLEPALIKSYQLRLMPVVNNVDLSLLLPRSLTYYHYQGSLTTPNCDERVQWFVLHDTIIVPQTYLEKLRKIKGKDNTAVTSNFRNLQNHNGRIVTVRCNSQDPEW